MLVILFVVVDALLYERNADFPAVDTRFPVGRCHLTVDRAMPGRGPIETYPFLSPSTFS